MAQQPSDKLAREKRDAAQRARRLALTPARAHRQLDPTAHWRRHRRVEQ